MNSSKKYNIEICQRMAKIYDELKELDSDFKILSKFCDYVSKEFSPDLMDYIVIGAKDLENIVDKKNAIHRIQDKIERKTLYGFCTEVAYSIIELCFGWKKEETHTIVKETIEFDVVEEFKFDRRKLDIIANEMHKKFGITLDWLLHGSGTAFSWMHSGRCSIEEIINLKPKNVYFVVAGDNQGDPLPHNRVVVLVEISKFVYEIFEYRAYMFNYPCLRAKICNI